MSTMQEWSDSSNPRPIEHMVNDTTIFGAAQLPTAAPLFLLSASSSLSSITCQTYYLAVITALYLTIKLHESNIAASQFFNSVQAASLGVKDEIISFAFSSFKE
eukprot:7303998-Ditylum_brightwellii.AAC.1